MIPVCDPAFAVLGVMPDMLYSVEFFEQARARLADGGIMAQWIPIQAVREPRRSA